MGKGRDKRKKQRGSITAGRGADKTQRKTEKNEGKKQRRSDRRAEDDDIDAILERLRLDDAAKTRVTVEENCAAPEPRVYATYTAVQSERGNNVVIFGGECEDLDTGRMRMYNDLYIYKCDKDRWTRITSPNSPPPRSGHQTVVHKKFLYMFGGEFTSPRQERFHHYRDLWRFNLEASTWESLPMRRGPTARSGHRMAVYKNKIYLFGGFYDTGRDEMRYHNDLWVLDLEEVQWTPVAQATNHGPCPRGGCQVIVFEDVLYLYGGYSKYKDDEDAEMEHGVVHDDMWALDLKTHKWEKVKKAGMAPGARSGFGWVPHKRKAVLFGGVTDNEARLGEVMASEFHSELYQFNFDRRRWFPVTMRSPAGKGKRPVDGAGKPRGEEVGKGAGEAGSSDCPETAATASCDSKAADRRVHNAVVKIQSRYRGYVVRKAYKLYRIGGVVSEVLYSPAAYGVDLSSRNAPKPRARIGAGMAVLRNTLWLFGGVVEVGDRDVTLDDVWALDLGKLDGWRCLRENSAEEQAFQESDGGSGSGSEDSEECGE
ncbi:unnamed protein product [Ostreobium quekettii]|uniref:Kelch repeat protein n=1 Tax=Ostreobium quekettii TaxID=121088 RepID=A0A8S1J7R2_9CHLO|nr:unnamed protein product [Ostreobium quekettii]|eukprot:evm.model.scf_928.4 EVM.evm.TU.scf_928.4   scf_928:16566-24211(+)